MKWVVPVVPVYYVPEYYGMGGAGSAGVRGECGSRFSAAASAGQHTL